MPGIETRGAQLWSHISSPFLNFLFFESGPHKIAEAGLELLIPLSQPPKLLGSQVYIHLATLFSFHLIRSVCLVPGYIHVYLKIWAFWTFPALLFLVLSLFSALTAALVSVPVSSFRSQFLDFMESRKQLLYMDDYLFRSWFSLLPLRSLVPYMENSTEYLSLMPARVLDCFLGTLYRLPRLQKISKISEDLLEVCGWK